MLEQWQAERLTEADTRVKIIDVLLKDVLGWDEGAIRRETRSAGADDDGYIDYTLVSECNRFLVEAKRSGVYFNMPVGGRMKARSDGVIARSRDLSRAIEQVRSYCLQQVMPVGIVSNGLQLAAVLVHKQPVGTYDVLLFSGLEAIDQQFILFWNILSPWTNAQRELEAALATQVLRDPPQFQRRVLDDITRRDESISRNPIDAHLRPHIQRYFSDMTEAGKEAVLRECFCDTPRQQQYEKQLGVFLAASPAAVDRPIERVETQRRYAGKFGERYQEAVQAGSAVFLLVGGVGAGKTTFIHRFFRFILDESTQARTIWLYVDFTRTPSEEHDAEAFATSELLRELREKFGTELGLEEFGTLQRVYESEIAGCGRALGRPFTSMIVSSTRRKWGSSSRSACGTTMRIWQHSCVTSVSGTPVCLILDNADQLGSEFQREAILVAFRKARVYGTVVLLSLREETYWRHRTLEPLDAYQSAVYYITPPTLEELLSKRLQMLRREHGDEIMELPSSAGLRVSGIKLAEFMGIVVDSLLGEDRTNLTTLEALAAQNMRRALDMFGTFLSSGHTNTDEYIRTYIEHGSYLIPNHALIRSLALGDRRYYDSQRSHVANLYSLSDDGFYSHFNKLRVLQYLQERVHADSPVGQGFVPSLRWHGIWQPCVRTRKDCSRS